MLASPWYQARGAAPANVVDWADRPRQLSTCCGVGASQRCYLAAILCMLIASMAIQVPPARAADDAADDAAVLAALHQGIVIDGRLPRSWQPRLCVKRAHLPIDWFLGPQLVPAQTAQRVSSEQDWSAPNPLRAVRMAAGARSAQAHVRFLANHEELPTADASEPLPPADNAVVPAAQWEEQPPPVQAAADARNPLRRPALPARGNPLRN